MSATVTVVPTRYARPLRILGSMPMASIAWIVVIAHSIVVVTNEVNQVLRGSPTRPTCASWRRRGDG